MMSVVFIRSYVFSLTALVFSGLLEGGVIRVKSGVDVLNVASGSDWHADVTNLQRALSLAVDGDEIWVAAGTYYPDEGQGQVDDDRYSVFRLKSGVVLYGGFQGNESDSSKRNPAANVLALLQKRKMLECCSAVVRVVQRASEHLSRCENWLSL